MFENFDKPLEVDPSKQLEVGKYYIFNNYYTTTKYVFKVVSYNDPYYIVEHLEISPYKKHKGSNQIDKWTIENWIKEKLNEFINI